MSNELVKVTLTPQGTADVYIGELHIKTFGGKDAHQAAADFAQQIKMQLAQPAVRLTGFVSDRKHIPLDLDEFQNGAVYKQEITVQTSEPKDKQNAKTRTEGKQSG